MTYYALKAMSALRLVWDLKPVPEAFRTPKAEAA